MPAKPMKPCPGRCGRLVTSGLCAICSSQRERRRGSAAQRGYGSVWQDFRPRFIAMLVEAGVLPICGASLPGGPQTSDSRCQADGLQNGEDLHLDHEPPLTDAERLDARIVCDPLRIQLLCGVDHSRKTRLEQHGVMG